jgi:hydrogenase expression/formation protein HypC
MCLAVPMELVEIRPDGTALAEVDGARYAVNLALLESPKRGDFVIVHAGFAIQKLDREEADARLALFEELAAHRAEAAAAVSGKAAFQ